jgi:hypothetical protein
MMKGFRLRIADTPCSFTMAHRAPGRPQRWYQTDAFSRNHCGRAAEPESEWGSKDTITRQPERVDGAAYMEPQWWF